MHREKLHLRERFTLELSRRRIEGLEFTMHRMEQELGTLQRFVHDEEQRTRVHDRRHHRYSSAAAAAADRIGRLTKSIGELRTTLAASRLEHDGRERQLSFRAGTSTPLSVENATTARLSFSPRRQSRRASAASALPVAAATE